MLCRRSLLLRLLGPLLLLACRRLGRRLRSRCSFCPRCRRRCLHSLLLHSCRCRCQRCRLGLRRGLLLSLGRLLLHCPGLPGLSRLSLMLLVSCCLPLLLLLLLFLLHWNSLNWCRHQHGLIRCRWCLRGGRLCLHRYRRCLLCLRHLCLLCQLSSFMSCLLHCLHLFIRHGDCCRWCLCGSCCNACFRRCLRRRLLLLICNGLLGRRHRVGIF